MSTTQLISGPGTTSYRAVAILVLGLLAMWDFKFSGSNLSENQSTKECTKRPEIGSEQGLVDDRQLAAICHEGVPSFMGLGDLPGSVFGSSAYDVSQDGSVVVGYSNTEQGFEAFRWTRAEGMTNLGFFMANGVSGDGSVVVGLRRVARGSEAVGWTMSNGTFSLGTLPNYHFLEAYAVSADGSVIVGSCDSYPHKEAFCWTESEGAVHLLADLPGAHNSVALGVSADGSVVVGRSGTSPGGEAFRWTRAGGMVSLGTLPGDSFSEARAVSGDGAVVVGLGSREAFLWTQRDGMVPLGSHPGGIRLKIANGVSADGSVVVGIGVTKSGYRACIWDAAHGSRTVRDVLEKELGHAKKLSGWGLMSADAISADGCVVVGSGINPRGDMEAWLARLEASPGRPIDRDTERIETQLEAIRISPK